MKNTRKKWLGILALLLAAAAVFFVPRTVLAAEEKLALSLDTGAVSGVEDADLAVIVNFEGTSVGALSGDLVYESGKVTFISAESSGEAGTAFSAVDDGEKVRFVWGDAAEAAGGGEIARFYFSLDDRADLVTFSLDDESLTACRAEDGEVVYFELAEAEEVLEAVNVGASYEVNNKHDQYYTTYAYPVTANLIAVDGGFLTVDKTKDADGNARLLVKTYDSAYKLTGSRYIDGELPLYGGFYASDDAYYYLSGQENPEESDEVEVFRITKYDTSWKKLGSASLYGANTYIPFDAGSARFAEYGKYLFIRTCHEMYKSSDGYHHQANVAIKLDTSAMTIASSFTGVYNIANGYVSHSFNQFIMVDDDGYVAALDHGDAYPRAAALGRYGKKADSVVFGTGAAYTYSQTLEYYGSTGDNTTNASIGGLAFSEDNYLTAGNSNPQDGSTVKVRNVYVSVNPRSGFPGTPTVTWLSNYAEGGTTTASTPHLVKINDDLFAVLWEEFELGGWYTTETLNCRYAFIDGSGSVKSSGSFKGYLSDCAPVAVGDDVVWYVTENDQTTFFVLGQDGSLAIQGDMVELTSAENESGGVRLTWSRDKYSGYLNIYRRDNTYYTSDAHADWELLGTVLANSYLDETAVAGHGYYYTVRAATYDGEELPRAWDEVGTYIVRVPAPELTSVAATANGPKITWNTTSDGSNVTAYMSNQYAVWRKTEGSQWVQIGTAGNENSAYAFTWNYTDTTAEAGKTYSYTVSAIMTRMGETFEGPKDETGLSILYLKQPAVTKLTADSTGVNVSWSAAAGAESYKVYRMSRSVLEFVKEKESQGITAVVEWTVAGATAGTSLKDTGVSCGEWYYIVQAVSGSYESAKDFELSDPHIVFVPEVDIRTYGYSSQKAAVYLNWVWSSNYSGYAVYRRTDGGEWSLVGTIEGTSAVTYYDEEPLFGTVTEYMVAAFYTDGDGAEHEGFKADPGVTVDLNKMRFYEVSAEESTYTGSAITPSFKVVNADDGSELSSAYYTAEFSNNVNVGTGTITVTGKGEYSGTITGTFEIKPKAVAASMIGAIAEQTYNGSQIKPAITVKDGSKTLAEGTDYTVSYGENIYPETGTVTITGMGNYTGSAEKSFVIDGGPILSISLAETDITMVYGAEQAVPAVTYEPDFTSDEKTVTWSSSDEKVVKVENGRIKTLNAGRAVLTAAVPNRDVTAEVNVMVLFKDVTDTNSWYYDSVYWALEKNVTSGMGAGTFQPLADLSRAQTVMFLYKLAEQPDVSGLTVQEFEDVAADAWYHDAVKWAVANEITTGYGSGTFRPDLTCNRAMIVTFLMRYAKYAGTYKAPTAAATFTDVAAGAWYEEAVNWAVESGVTTGYGEGTFQPMRTCNRAMMVTFLKRAAELPKA